MTPSVPVPWHPRPIILLSNLCCYRRQPCRTQEYGLWQRDSIEQAEDLLLVDYEHLRAMGWGREQQHQEDPEEVLDLRGLSDSGESAGDGDGRGDGDGNGNTQGVSTSSASRPFTSAWHRQ
jgi:hypothetical protein